MENKFREKRRRQDGSILMIVMFIAGILGVTLASYLLMVRAHYVSVVRSQSWNVALAMAEAGAEEALAQLNPGAAAPPPLLSANGWQLIDGAYRISRESRTLTNGSYAVLIMNEPGRVTLTNYVIYSTGYATVPSIPATLSRVLRVTVTNAPLFTAAVAAHSNITMAAGKGTGVFADSFDSQNPSRSENGQYPTNDPSKTSLNGDVACLAGKVTIGTDVIHGDLLLGLATAIGTNNVFGKVTRDFNADFPDVQAPFVSAIPPISGAVDGTNYAYLLTGGNYLLSSGTMQGNVMVTGMSVLYVTKDAAVNFAASDSISIAANASLKLYVGSPSANLPPLINPGDPGRFVYFGLPTNTKLSQQLDGEFVGSIYAPSADLTINASRRNRCDFVGSCMTRSVAIINRCSFHFDENLLRSGNPRRGYVVTSWREL